MSNRALIDASHQRLLHRTAWKVTVQCGGETSIAMRRTEADRDAATLLAVFGDVQSILQHAQEYVKILDDLKHKGECTFEDGSIQWKEVEA